MSRFGYIDQCQYLALSPVTATRRRSSASSPPNGFRRCCATSMAFPLGAQSVDPSITTHEIFDLAKLAEACLLLRARIMQSKLEARKITLSMLAAAQEAKLPFVS
ncbi:hypothetical protein OKW28_002617 [Paraburkholderia sp. 40]